MSIIKIGFLVVCTFLINFTSAYAEHNPQEKYQVDISFIEFESIDLENNLAPLTIKGKLQLPIKNHCHQHHKLNHYECSSLSPIPAVVILHGSLGVDSRGNFYAESLNQAGIATLEIDMWEARGIEAVADRPALPIYTYPDAFAALDYLSQRSDIDPDRIGVLGFSWGGIITMATATQAVVSEYGNGLHFAAHEAHSPVCFIYNSSIPGSDFSNLTGAPILVQVGENDDYDLSSAPCQAVKASLTEEEQSNFEVVSYEGAYHDFDRLKVPTSVEEPYANLGQGGEVRLIPNVEAAYKARKKSVEFFSENLLGNR